MMTVKKKLIIKYFAVACLCLSYHSVYALGKVSRACPVADIPSGLKTAALQFFEVIGDSSIGSLTPIASKTYNDQSKYYILESLTTDYLQARYYLYAENRTRKIYIPFNIYQSVINTDYIYKSTWIASSLPDSLLVDSRKLCISPASLS